MATGTLAITWLGHSAFSVRTPGGKTILFDPWYTGNPELSGRTEPPKQADLILLSHGHSDHSTDAAATAKATGATVVGDLGGHVVARAEGRQARRADEQGRHDHGARAAHHA